MAEQMTKAHVDRLFERLCAKYGTAKMYQVYGQDDIEAVKTEWLTELKNNGVSVERVKLAIDNVALYVKSGFFPDVSMFLDVCEKVKPLMKPEPPKPSSAPRIEYDCTNAKADFETKFGHLYRRWSVKA